MIKIKLGLGFGLVCLGLSTAIAQPAQPATQPKTAAPIEPTPSEPPSLIAPLPVPPALFPQVAPQQTANPFAPTSNPFSQPTANPFALVSVPSNSTVFARLVTLPKIAEQQIRELILDAITVLEVTQNYKRVREDAAKDLPLVPDKIQLFGIAQRVVGNKKDYVRLGVLQHPRRLPQLWIEGRTVTDGATIGNPDAD